MYTAKEDRYENMIYNRCGKSGLKLPALSLGMWHNFGSVNDVENMKKILLLPLTTGSPTLTWPTITARFTEVRRPIWAGS